MLVPEIFKFKKCVKYANERTHDVFHSTQYNIKHTNRAILVNFRQKLLKHGRLIILQATHYGYKIFGSHGNSLFSSLPNLISMFLVILSSKKHLARAQTRPNMFIYLLDHEDEAPLANIKIER